ncbi:MAG TPA: valine--tRNA ligase [Candidatus Paceibacterota bacterium]|nr:valine--tRNA ligase [Candidatus Paceibacterota bacterium]
MSEAPDKFNTPYQPQNVEGEIYKKWEESGFFNPDNLPLRLDAQGKQVEMEPFTIIMPPPNANGSLHAGHALFVTVQDILMRFERMRGKKTLWVPGADHAGFETQVVYEKKLEKEGRSRFEMQADDLYKEIMDFTLSNKSFMEGQIRQLGASCDWSREVFTLDERVIDTVYDTFKKLNDDGLLYRAPRIVNWCPKHQTSLSNLETERETRTDKFYYLKYGPFTIATARPETKFGDKYVVMHPDDKRYAQYSQGQQFELEWINGPITATVIKDESIDMELGTGVMTITPWHDPIDFDIAKRHNLPYEQVIDWRGKLLPIAGEFEGMNIKDARAKIVEKLQSKGLVEKIDETYSHEVPVCYKCGREIEPQVRPQWFISMQPLAQKAIEAVKNGDVRVLTENHEKILLHWLENIQDWNISRQIVWGIPIPAWSRSTDAHGKQSEEWKIQVEDPGDGWTRDPDTFDTWFSSGQWPFATLGYPDSNDFKTFYPTSVMETGADILFFWVARMLMLGLYRTGKVPFRDIYLHGLVRDAKGQKMSKSKGNVISPLEISNEYGTDALRMGLIVGNTPGTDLNLDPRKIGAYKKFANKIWNIARFVLSQEHDGEIKSELKDEFDAIAADVTKDIEEYRIYMAADKLYHYVWDRFAAEILEESKGKPEYGATLYYLLENSLKLLHPFMPFLTEEIWGSLPNKSTLLLIETWPVNARN